MVPMVTKLVRQEGDGEEEDERRKTPLLAFRENMSTRDQSQVQHHEGESTFTILASCFNYISNKPRRRHILGLNNKKRRQKKNPEHLSSQTLEFFPPSKWFPNLILSSQVTSETLREHDGETKARLILASLVFSLHFFKQLIFALPVTLLLPSDPLTPNNTKVVCSGNKADYRAVSLYVGKNLWI